MKEGTSRWTKNGWTCSSATGETCWDVDIYRPALFIYIWNTRQKKNLANWFKGTNQQQLLHRVHTVSSRCSICSQYPPSPSQTWTFTKTQGSMTKEDPLGDTNAVLKCPVTSWRDESYPVTPSEEFNSHCCSINIKASKRGSFGQELRIMNEYADGAKS